MDIKMMPDTNPEKKIPIAVPGNIEPGINHNKIFNKKKIIVIEIRINGFIDFRINKITPRYKIIENNWPIVNKIISWPCAKIGDEKVQIDTMNK